jgi:hypothetical protein
MDINAWQHWLFLRPLVVFLLACPLLIAAVLVGWHKERRNQKHAGETQASGVPAATTDTSRRGYEAAWSAKQTPHEWNGGPPKADRDRRVA